MLSKLVKVSNLTIHNRQPYTSVLLVLYVGFAGGIFTPDIAFDSIVKGLINKMKEPSLRCVDLVINELTQNIKRSSQEVSTTLTLYQISNYSILNIPLRNNTINMLISRCRLKEP